MATYIQRWQALGEALLGKPATTAQLTRLGDAIAASTPVMGGTQYAQMTNAQKAEFCVKTMLIEVRLTSTGVVQDSATVTLVGEQV